MIDPTIPAALYWLALFCLFIGFLCVGGLCVQLWLNRPHWLRRLLSGQELRARMATDWKNAACDDLYRQKVSHAASLIEERGWRGPDAERLTP